MDWITDPQIWISLVSLTVLEIVLGIDNIIFISILAGKLPTEQQQKARQVGLLLALVSRLLLLANWPTARHRQARQVGLPPGLAPRLLLLASIAWIAKLTTPLFTVFDHGFSGRDLILIGGGLFLLAKSTHEIHEKLEGVDGG